MTFPRRQPRPAAPAWQEKQKMATFVAAYAAAWLAVVLYLARLGAQQRRLAATVESLQRRLEQPSVQERPPAAAA